MRHLAAAIVAVPLALAAGALPAAATTMSNESFAGKVRMLRQQMAREPAAVARAEDLCAHLPAHRAADEPACLALRLHQRAAGADAPSGNGLVGPMLERALRSVVGAMSRTDA